MQRGGLSTWSRLTIATQTFCTGPENDLAKKVKLLETAMIEKMKEMSKLESEVEDLKSINSDIKSTDPIVKKGEEIFDKALNENKPTQNVKDHGASVKNEKM